MDQLRPAKKEFSEFDKDGVSGLSLDETSKMSTEQVGEQIGYSLAYWQIEEEKAATFIKGFGIDKGKQIMSSMKMHYPSASQLLCNDLTPEYFPDGQQCGDFLGQEYLALRQQDRWLPYDFGLLDELPSTMPGRNQYVRPADYAFVVEVNNVFSSGRDFSNTLFIVDTGHSIPAGVTLADKGYLYAARS